ncbi:MAG: SDR family oxidoreductase [Anaerolineae bacterium]|jgi:putative NADH-flavin reductase|nr:SDR family oxidoreductase [Anaerolineae bacterium]
MKLAIFGGSGKTGRHLVEQALQAGHEVVALVRNPARLNLQHERLHIVPGDILNAAQVAAAVQGVEAVVSVLGPPNNRPEYTISQGMQHILHAMQQHGVQRLVISAGAGVPDEHDTPQFINHVISFVLRLVSRYVVEDMERVVALVRQSGVDWTIVRVPMLTDQPGGRAIRTGYVGQGTGAQLSRADMAAFMLRQVTDRQYVRLAPVISN